MDTDGEVLTFTATPTPAQRIAGNPKRAAFMVMTDSTNAVALQLFSSSVSDGLRFSREAGPIWVYGDLAKRGWWLTGTASELVTVITYVRK